MTGSFALLKQRRFLPLFVTQLLGAFNDNLFKNAMVLFVVYGVFNDEASETLFSAVATALFIIPFFLLSALAGQLADTRDKARIIRIRRADKREHWHNRQERTGSFHRGRLPIGLRRTIRFAHRSCPIRRPSGILRR